jgi:hypothetical protein
LPLLFFFSFSFLRFYFYYPPTNYLTSLATYEFCQTISRLEKMAIQLRLASLPKSSGSLTLLRYPTYRSRDAHVFPLRTNTDGSFTRPLDRPLQSELQPGHYSSEPHVYCNMDRSNSQAATPQPTGSGCSPSAERTRTHSLARVRSKRCISAATATYCCLLLGTCRLARAHQIVTSR